MPLIVTPGAPDADSYADLTALDAYHATRGNAAWGAAATEAKEAAARRATSWLDGRYGGRWPGVRTQGRDQALGWPRAGAEDRDGYPVASDAIPSEVVRATCEAALRELAAPGSLSPDVTPGSAKVLTGVGKLTWTPLRQNADAADMAPTLLAVDGLLAPLLRAGGANVDLVRA